MTQRRGGAEAQRRLGFGACGRFGRESVGLRGFVRIRIFRIIGFSGFVRRVSKRQALIHIRFDGIFVYGEKRKPDGSEILKILVLTKPRVRPQTLDSRFRGNDGVGKRE